MYIFFLMKSQIAISSCWFFRCKPEHECLHPSKPTVLFEKPYFIVFAYHGSVYLRSYDVTPDGRRFLMIKENEQVSAATRINVFLN
jgi:hypothetical protein